MYVCARACECVYIRQDLSFYLVNFNRRVLIFFVFFCVMAGQKSVFWSGRYVFVLFPIFYFLKIYFLFFLIIESRYLNRMGSIQKRIKIAIFSKQKVSSYHGSLVIYKNKNFFFFFKGHNSLMMVSCFKMWWMKSIITIRLFWLVFVDSFDWYMGASSRNGPPSARGAFFA